MTEMSDKEWQQWLQDLSHPNDLTNNCSFDLGVGAPKIDLNEVNMLQFLTISPNEPNSNSTTEHSWFSNDQQVPDADPKDPYLFEQSINDVHLLMQKLQHELATLLTNFLDEN